MTNPSVTETIGGCYPSLQALRGSVSCALHFIHMGYEGRYHGDDCYRVVVPDGEALVTIWSGQIVEVREEEHDTCF